MSLRKAESALLTAIALRAAGAPSARDPNFGVTSLLRLNRSSKGGTESFFGTSEISRLVSA